LARLDEQDWKSGARECSHTRYRKGTDPKFKVTNLIAEGDSLAAIGEITLDGIDYSYCDVWRFRDGKMAELKAFVIKTEGS